MRHNRRTPHRPLFDVMRPVGNHWTWAVTYTVASSGYVDTAMVTAFRRAEGEVLSGMACCDVQHDSDLSEVLEFLAVESMLAACEPTLTGEMPVRRLTFVSSSY